MKIQSVKYPHRVMISSNSTISKTDSANVKFAGNLATNKSNLIDGILQNKWVQKSFNLASLNPHAFSLSVMAVIGIMLRPATILVVPGAKKEDKQYAAGKSVVSSAITTAVHLALFIPLATQIEKLAVEAEKNPHLSKFPKFKSPKFEAFNYLVNNGAAIVLTLASSMIMAEAVTKIMNKLLPQKKKLETTNPNYQIIDATPKVFDTFKGGGR